MGRVHHSHERLHLQRRNDEPNLNAKPSPLAKLLDTTMIRLSNFSKRATTGSDNSDSEGCTEGDKSNLCAKPSDSNNITLPILLGVLYALFISYSRES